MTVTVTHSFNCAIADDAAAAAAGQVVPSNWNAVHTVSGLGYFATGTDGSNLTGSVASNLLNGTISSGLLVGSYTGITALGTLTALTISGALTYGGVALSSSVTGTGSMVLATSPTLTTPALGVATATSLAIGGATIGSNALAVTGTVAVSGSGAFGGASAFSATGSAPYITATSAITFGAAGTTSLISSPSDGVISLYNNAVSGFTRLQFGGTTSSFPAIKRSAAGIHVRLADDSAYTFLSAAVVNLSDYLNITGSGGSGVNLFNPTGTTIAVRNGVNSADAPITAAAGTFSGNVTGTNVSITAGSAFQFGASRAQMLGPADGVITLYNAAATDFSRLQFGGTTSSFPALKRNFAVLEAKVADDSAYTGVNVLNVSFPTNGGVISNPADGVLMLQNAALTSFTRLQFGGTTSSFPALGRSGATIQVLTADGGGYTDLYAGNVKTNAASGIPAGGTAGAGFTFGSGSNFGVFFGSSAPTLSAAKGSLYLRSDGSTTNDRMYVNTNGSTTWTAVTTAA